MVRLWAVVGIVAIFLSATDAEARRKRRGRKGALVVTCSVVGAKVMVDGRVVGKTPLKQQAVAGGNHTVKVKKLGFLDFSEKVQIRPGKTVRMYADLLPFAGVVKVTANVSKARVSVDGRSWGKAPIEREVKLGSHTVTVTAPGYAPYSETISADPGNVYTVTAKLRKGSASADDDLALAPVVGSGASDDGDLSLEPFADAGGGSDLSLAPLPGLTGSSGDGNGLELTALAPLPGRGRETAAVDPSLGPSVGTTVEPAKPWYFEWWAITGAAAVVVTGVVVSTVVLTGGETEEESDPWEAVWQPNESWSGW